jgi:hypothetical protein
MSLEVRIKLEPKAWLRFLDKLAAANMMHEYNAIEAGYQDAKRSKELAVRKNHRLKGQEGGQKSASMAAVRMVDL